MQITIELQDMFSYSVWPVVLGIALLVIIGVIGFVIFISKKKSGKPVDTMPEPVPKPILSNRKKEKYCALINDLEAKCRSGKVSNRKAYQELSRIVRHFVYEITGVKVHHHTLEEIEHLNMPDLYALIKECYAPEFSVDKKGSIYDTMNKARMVIKEWH